MPWAQPHVSVFIHSTEVSAGVIHHTFEFFKIFPIKIYQNCCREEIGADQCYC